MEDNFNHDDFEEFLQDQVRNHRMYPSDAVWREIDRKLHGEKRWPALTVAAVALLTITVLICVYFTPKPNIFAVKPIEVNNSTLTSTPKDNILNNPTSLAPNRVQVKPSSIQDIPSVATGKSGANSAVSTDTRQPTISKPISTVFNDSKAAKSSTGESENAAKLVARDVEITQPQSAQQAEAVEDESDLKAKTTDEAVTTASPEIVVIKAKASPSAMPAPKEPSDRNMVDGYLKEHKDEPTVVTSYTHKNKFSFQLYFAPSVSYRKLLEDQSSLQPNSGGPIGLNYVTDVNKVVRHKPGTGIEAGFSVMYNLSSKVRVKSGFQFNVRQYSIEAYRSSMELASIALAGRNGMDTVNTLSTYRNNNGYYSAELVNRYYQLSVPLGLEWEVIGNKTLQLNIGGTIQPTYLVNRNAYLLSSNFKNYTENPGIVRPWNINSNIEAFITYKVGDFKWQLGPQLRYQPYSTFIPEYAIKEHLLDYGVKLGFTHAFK